MRTIAVLLLKKNIMGLGGFFKNLFGSAKENVDQLADKAEGFAEEAIEKAKKLN